MQGRSCLKNKGPLVQLGEHLLFSVEFIVDFANDFFHDVLEGYHTRNSAVLINHYGKVHFFCPKIAQQIVNFHGFRDEHGRPN